MILCASLWQDRAFPSSVGRGGLLVPLQVPDALPPFLVGGRCLLLAPGGGRRFSLPNRGGEPFDERPRDSNPGFRGNQRMIYQLRHGGCIKRLIQPPWRNW